MARKLTYCPYGPALLERDEVLLLAGSLGTSQVEAAGFIALLVGYALSMGDEDGTIDHLSTHHIERACYWTGEPGALVEAFEANAVCCGHKDDDDDPLRISPVLWELLAGTAIKKRKDNQRRQKEHRAGN